MQVHLLASDLTTPPYIPNNPHPRHTPNNPPPPSSISGTQTLPPLCLPLFAKVHR
jgi:hypothetical protein